MGFVLFVAPGETDVGPPLGEGVGRGGEIFALSGLPTLIFFACLPEFVFLVALRVNRKNRKMGTCFVEK